MSQFESLFAAMHEACDPRRKKYLATYFETASKDSRAAHLFPGLTAGRREGWRSVRQ
jgi:hypothetical protein